MLTRFRSSWPLPGWVGWRERMEATAPRVPWWYFVLAGQAMTLCLGLLRGGGFGWPVQIAAVMLVLLGLLIVVRRGRA